MSNAQHTVENNGYIYEVKPLERDHPESVNLVQARFYAHFMQAFGTAQKEWEEQVKEDPLLSYGDSWYLYSMVLGVDGVPAAMVMNVDGIVQTFPFSSGEKIEVDQ